LSNSVILFSATKGKEEWQILESGTESKVEGDLNIVSAWQWPSFYDATSKTLLFNSMKRPDSKGMDDINVAQLSGGKWIDVQNLGEVVNTAAYEDGAILSHDTKLLIFCRHDTGLTPSKVLCVEVNEFPTLFEQK
jgi:hypothetical protein